MGYALCRRPPTLCTLGLQIPGIVASGMVVIWLFGASTLASWGNLARSWDDPGTVLGRSWDIGGHKEGPCEVQAWILSIFC